MAEISTVARPYAEATFRAAVEKNALGAGRRQPRAGRRHRARRADAFRARQPEGERAAEEGSLRRRGGGELDRPLVGNLLSILVDGHRELLIGSIAEQFEALKHEHEKVVRARSPAPSR